MNLGEWDTSLKNKRTHEDLSILRGRRRGRQMECSAQNEMDSVCSYLSESIGEKSTTKGEAGVVAFRG